ncbi:MAG: flagella basal body P-ring formation protein FlgA, partial [Undibacterium sp.]|nr:flagella basal body P-ring formation protein FlgA [Undibacterium sp.]
VSLHLGMFKQVPVIKDGQTIKINNNGLGFKVSNEATAIGNASEGQLARAKTASGQVIAGIARFGGIIEVR